jgi:hypothetical protein
VGVLEGLQHLKLVMDHILITANILFENNLDRDLFSIGGVRLANDAVSACTQRPSEPVESPTSEKGQ